VLALALLLDLLGILLVDTCQIFVGVFVGDAIR